MNPVIKFTTLFGLLAVELGVYLTSQGNGVLSKVLAVVFFVIALVFVHRSFYGMRIEVQATPTTTARPVAVKA
jgi:K(+)-stimulated pyrophosphate-energized sodium pump